MGGIIVQDDGSFSSVYFAGMLERAGYKVRKVQAVTAELAAEKPDLIIMYVDGEVIPGITQLAILNRRNSYSEKLLREAGVHCIQNVNALNIVQIVEERLHIPK
ncbi:MAG: hypothetical protein IJ060_09355 [Oscillospiraceae bacterium]|nr:hypothetical protein [Oscillospiraceae bacterium]